MTLRTSGPVHQVGKDRHEGVLYYYAGWRERGNEFSFSFQMSSWEHIVATQIADGAVYPLSRFIDTELHEMDTMGSMYQVRTSITLIRNFG